MEEELPFLAAIRRRYWDESHRLIYADWLDERGESDRAEFIRVQCTLQKTPWYDPGRPELALRERSLQNEFSREWAAPLLELGAQRVIFQGGVIEGIEVSGRAFVDAGDEFFQRCPTLRIAHVSLHNVSLERFLRSGVVARLTELTLAHNRLTDRALEMLALSPDLERLIALNLAHNDFGPRGLRALGEATALGQLRLLNLTGDRLTGLAIEPIPGPRLPRLSRLILDDNQLDAGSFWSLLQRLPQTAIRLLSVADNQIRMPHERGRFPLGLSRLESLSLAGNPVGDGMAVSLAYSRHVARLTRLDLQRTGVTPVGARALAASPHLSALVELNLSGNPIPPADAPAFGAGWLPEWLLPAHRRHATNPYTDLRKRFGPGVTF